MSEHDLVVAALRALKPSIRPSSDPAWGTPPALRVIDCVLSLNRPYRKVVEPRRNRFASQHPHIKAVADLHREIRRYSSAYDFLRQTLDTDDKDRAETLANVTAWLASIGGDGNEAEQLANIKVWAVRAQFRDHKTLGIRGFGLSGFQYLRMLFGADTCKPDLRIRQWVSKALGQEVSFDKADKRNLVSDIRALIYWFARRGK